MWRILKHPLSIAALTLLGLYVVFAFVLQPPLPKSLLIQYMVICAVGVLLVMSFDDATASRAISPVKALVSDPKLKVQRFAALTAVMLGAAGMTYHVIKPSSAAPVELRTVHPAPPSNLRAFGKTYNMLSLENPVRKANPKGTPGYSEVIKAGGELYYKNCMYCHGDLLDGQGHFGKALNPRPANFQDVGTIAQLQESYLFWRIATGGPGLPREGSPWASAMPVWHEMLNEEDIWKIITFLYDYTGQVPRSWELDTGTDKSIKNKHDADAAAPQQAAQSSGGGLDETAVTQIYEKRCAQCHGAEGDGTGPAADFMYPKPRDFTLAVFKYKTTHADSELPTDDDLRKTIKDGIRGTAMPEHTTTMRVEDRWHIVNYVMTLRNNAVALS